MPVEACRTILTPIGTLLLSAHHHALTGLVILGGDDEAAAAACAAQMQAVLPNSPVLQLAVEQLDQYFSGCRREFQLPFDLTGLSPSTRTILAALQSVPFGATITYGALAARAGMPRAARAVGGAMAANPLPIVIPCHRVVAAGGCSGGYSGGGGVRTKEWLLAFERDSGPAN